MALFPRETRFYDLIESQANTVVKGARLLRECLESSGSADEMARMSDAIHAIEHEGDDLVHEVMGKLNTTFITPLDREDIYALCSRLDDILDYVDAVAKRLVTFRIEAVTDHAVELSRILDRSAEEVRDAIRLLRDLRKHEEIVRQCARINQLENEADTVMRQALYELFNGESVDPVRIIKWMDLYEHLEIATDKCEDVANVIEAVLLKYS